MTALLAFRTLVAPRGFHVRIHPVLILDLLSLFALLIRVVHGVWFLGCCVVVRSHPVSLREPASRKRNARSTNWLPLNSHSVDVRSYRNDRRVP